MTIQASQLLDIAKNVLIRMGVHGFRDVELTLAKKERKEWLVNFSYKDQLAWYDKHACFAIDVESGEIRGMWLDRVWK